VSDINFLLSKREGCPAAGAYLPGLTVYLEPGA